VAATIAADCRCSGREALLCLLGHSEPARNDGGGATYDIDKHSAMPVLSAPYPISADAFVSLAASVGLFCDEPPPFEEDVRAAHLAGVGAGFGSRPCVSLVDPRRYQAIAHPLSVSDSAYRHNGVYVVIGGLGEVWTRHMVSRYDADVVWIGRRAPDAEIEAKLDAVAALGRRPRYFAADASDEVVSDAALDDLAVSEEIRHYPDHERTTNSTGMW